MKQNYDINQIASKVGVSLRVQCLANNIFKNEKFLLVNSVIMPTAIIHTSLQLESA